MGRQILLGLSYSDEQRLLRSLQQDGFVALPDSPKGMDLTRSIRERIPPDDEASPDEYYWIVLPGKLIPVLESRLDEMAKGVPDSFTRDAQGFLYPTNTPCIEWSRSRRDLGSAGGGRLYVASQWDYGDLQHWLEPVVAEFERLRKLVKKWTVRRGSVYVSKELAGTTLGGASSA